MSVYADSSFIVSLYLTDTHSADARRRVQDVPPLILTPFHRAEWAHALAQHQFQGTIRSEDMGRINAQFAADEAAGLFRADIMPEIAFELCADLARKHGPRFGHAHARQPARGLRTGTQSGEILDLR